MKTTCTHLFALSMFAASGCGGLDAVDDGAEGLSAATTASGTTSAKLGSLSVSFTVAFRTVGSTNTVVIKGSSNTALDRVFSFVPDDAFGEATLTGPKTFEAVLDEPSEINTVLSGLPLLIALHTTSGKVQDYTAQVVVQPRFTGFQGSSKLYFEEDLEPVYAPTGSSDVSPLRYQGTVTSSASLSRLTASAKDGVPTLFKVSNKEYFLDWTYDDLALAFTPVSDPVTLSATFTDKSTASKQATIGLKVLKTGLTTDDPYNVWPSPECTPEVKACVEALPENAHDWSDCGTYRQTKVCAGL